MEQQEEEKELLDLENQFQQMAQKVREFRATLPDQLTSTLASLLASQRPVLHTHFAERESEPETGIHAGPDLEAGSSRDVPQQSLALSISDNQEDTEEVQLKQRISRNNSDLAVVLKRMKEYMLRMDRFESADDGTIPPAFKRRRTN